MWSNKKFMDELAEINVPDSISNQMVIDDFQSITDFNGLTAERLVVQYPALKFGTAHRLCMMASIPRLVVHDEVFGVPKMIADASGALYGYMLAGQDMPKADTRVKFDLAKHGDQLVKKMLDYFGTRTSLRNLALEIGLQLEPSFDETVTSVAQDLLRECINSCRLGNLFRQLAIDFDNDPGMTAFLSQFQPESIR